MKHKFTIMLFMIILVSSSSALAFNLGDYFPGLAHKKVTFNLPTVANEHAQVNVAENTAFKVEDNLLAVSDVLDEINSNQDALNTIERSGIESLTIKTEKRTVTIGYINGYVQELNDESDVVIETTEQKVNLLWDKYQDRSLKLKDVKDNLHLPFGLYWKVAYNLWG